MISVLLLVLLLALVFAALGIAISPWFLVLMVAVLLIGGFSGMRSRRDW